MKKKNTALAKDIWAEIRKTRSRFLSILCITLLGVGFFAGIKATCPNMKETAQQYFAQHNLMDMHLKSTWGFTPGDVETLKSQPDVAELSPGYSVDAFVQVNDATNLLLRAYSWKIGGEDTPDTLNLPVLKEGRWPQRADECLVDTKLAPAEAFSPGQTITLRLEEGDLSESLSTRQFTIVGRVESPLYVNLERGNSNLGNGAVEGFLYLPQESFAYEFYTDIFLTYGDAAALNFYEQPYQDLMEAKDEALQALAAQREKTRHDEIYQQAQEEIDSAQEQLDSGIAEYEKGKLELEEQIALATQKLEQADKKLQDGRSLLNTQQQQLVQGRAQYDAALAQLQQQEQALQASEESAQQGRAQMESLQAAAVGVQGLVARYGQQAIAPEQLPPQDLAAYQTAGVLDAFSGHISTTTLLQEYLLADPAGPEKQVFAGQLNQTTGGAQQEAQRQLAQLATQEQALADARQQLNAGFAQLAAQESTLQQGQEKIDASWQALDRGQREYESGLSALATQGAQGQQQLDEAAAEIEQGRAELLAARHDLNDLGSPTWYLMPRESNPGYANYTQDAERVDQVAAVFPIFFILVAALVCLTTMTRMVEEQRTQIGTLKALGYGKGATVFKYLIYALSASLIGSVLGLLVGFQLFPTIIFNAYRILYIMPPVLTPFRWNYAIWCTLAAMACTGLSAWAACQKELAETPAQLMRPKAPRSGKRVLLEQVGFLWRRLSFLQKVTLRNLFRYKKRILMTVVGVAGCTALMMAGFGMQNAISSIVDLQYQEIFTYNAFVSFDEAITGDERGEIAGQLAQSPLVSQALPVRQSSVELSSGKGPKKSAYLFVPQQPESLGDFITLRQRQSGQALALPQEGVVLTEKAARLLGVGIGDSVTLHQDDSHRYQVTVAAITENYTMNFIYLSPAQYQQSWGQSPKYNSFLVNMKDATQRDALSSSLLRNNNVQAVTFSEDSGTQFRDMVGSLNYIVLVLILCAGALAFVVLYNLANINVAERVREIATIKVLGFYDGEVSAYIYRENTLSALMGLGAGLLVGVPFVRFIVRTAEVDAVMFNPIINPGTFVFSALLTLLFTLVVNVAMHFRLKKVDMVQSLKSAE